MLSDRIKKFGIKANEPETPKKKNNTELSEQISAGEDSRDAAKEAISAAFEKAAASAPGPALSTYVDRKLDEVDRKQDEKAARAKTTPDPKEEEETEDAPDSEFGEIPLLLRYSASLQNIREAVKAESEKTRNPHPDVESNSPVEPVTKIPTEISTESVTEAKNDVSDKSSAIEAPAPKKGDGVGVEKTVRTYSFAPFSTPAPKADAAEDSTTVDTPKEKKEKSVILSKSCLFAPILVAVIEGLLLIVSKVNLSSLQHRDSLYLSMVVIQLMIYLIPGIFYCKLRHGSDISSLRIKATGIDKLYMSVISALLLLFAMTAFKIIYLKLGIYESRFAIYSPYLNISSFSSVAEIMYMSIAFVLIPAISEEFIFRSVVFGEYFHDGFGYLPAVVISSLLYAMLHFSLIRLPMYFVAGLILAITSIITDSVIISTVTAAVFGLLDIFTENYVASLMRSDYKVLLVFVVIALLLLFVTLFLAETERLFYTKGTSGDPTPKHRKRKEKPITLLGAAISSPSFIVCTVIFVLGIIVSKL